MTEFSDKRAAMFIVARLFKTSLMIATVTIFAIAGCRQQMADQPYQRPLEPSNFFDDGMASRPVVPGTVARLGKEGDKQPLNGKVDGKLVDTFPFPGNHGSAGARPGTL